MIYSHSSPVSDWLGLYTAPPITAQDGEYQLLIANNSTLAQQALRLRYEVFNLELGEGLAESHLSGLDQDAYDPTCHHLLVLHQQQVVGTYRLQTAEMAAQGAGFYSAGEFDLSQMPTPVLQSAVELGRACLHPAHRVPQALFLLWRGIALYMLALQKESLFGCCSLTSQEPAEGKAVMVQLQKLGVLHPSVQVQPLPEWQCYSPEQVFPALPNIRIPKLFRAYLRYGAKVCGEPALDRHFKTIDYFVLFDRATMDAQAARFFS
jgi:putative hemolysin